MNNLFFHFMAIVVVFIIFRLLYIVHKPKKHKYPRV